jgi:hypothetical protein
MEDERVVTDFAQLNRLVEKKRFVVVDIVIHHTLRRGQLTGGREVREGTTGERNKQMNKTEKKEQ